MKTRRLGMLLVAFGVLNFVAYGVFAFQLGGDAGNGRVEAGRYFLSAHGKDTEVSQAVFEIQQVAHLLRLGHALPCFRRHSHAWRILLPREAYNEGLIS